MRVSAGLPVGGLQEEEVMAQEIDQCGKIPSNLQGRLEPTMEEVKLVQPNVQGAQDT